MPSTRFQRAVASRGREASAQGISAHCLSARRGGEPDWYDDDPDPLGDDIWDPESLDHDEPQPEPGDFWPETDDD